MEQRYFIELVFNGKNYHGWQIQENAISVQETLNKGLSILLKENIETTGCGRTDTGVHAKQFFVHFNADLSIVKDSRQPNNDNPEIISEQSGLINLKHHLNRILPIDIAIKRIIPVNNDAHARFDAVSRTYEYVVYQEKNPFLQESGYFIHDHLNVELMNEAAKLLLNYVDFSCFSKSRTQVLTNNCNITKAVWLQIDDRLIFVITANRFLRNMVRAIVGTLLEIGREKITQDDFMKIIEGKKRTDAGVSVPACGLYLTKVEYPFMD